MPDTRDDRPLIPAPAIAADRGVVGRGSATASVTGVMVRIDASEPASRHRVTLPLGEVDRCHAALLRSRWMRSRPSGHPGESLRRSAVRAGSWARAAAGARAGQRALMLWPWAEDK